jgi:hypothetical protein
MFAIAIDVENLWLYTLGTPTSIAFESLRTGALVDSINDSTTTALTTH